MKLTPLFVPLEVRPKAECVACETRLIVAPHPLFVIRSTLGDTLTCILSAEKPLVCPGCGKEYESAAFFPTKEAALERITSLAKESKAAVDNGGSWTAPGLGLEPHEHPDGLNSLVVASSKR